MSTRTKIAESLSHPPGWVVVSVDPAPEGVDLTVKIARRHPDRPNLSPTGWQAAPHAYTPREIARHGNRLDLHFGPEMSRHVGVDTGIALEISALNVSERHFWPAIAAAHGEGNLDVTLPSAPHPPETVVKIAAPLPKPAEPPPDEPRAASVHPTVSPPSENGRGRAAWLGGALVVMIALAVGAYLLWPDMMQEQSGPDFEARYQSMHEAGGHADDLLSLGLEAMAAGQTDLGFRAITLAADRNLPSAKIRLARWYDPLETETGPVERSANVAALYYSDAAAGGDTSASSALARLCSAYPFSAVEGMQEFDKATHCP